MSQDFAKLYETILGHVIAKLKNDLSSRLTYHNVAHTLDVTDQAEKIAIREGIKDNEDLFLLKIAGLYHDTGFLYVYAGHEEKGCELAKEELPAFGLSSGQIKKICGMIIATKIPQSPKNKLEEIICDADLDYLGRDDFERISNNLYIEFLDFGFVKDHNDWMKKQVQFFESHHYFTKSSGQLRQPGKSLQLEKIKTYQPDTGNQ